MQCKSQAPSPKPQTPKQNPKTKQKTPTLKPQTPSPKPQAPNAHSKNKNKNQKQHLQTSHPKTQAPSPKLEIPYPKPWTRVLEALRRAGLNVRKGKWFMSREWWSRLLAQEHHLLARTKKSQLKLHCMLILKSASCFFWFSPEHLEKWVVKYF